MDATSAQYFMTTPSRSVLRQQSLVARKTISPTAREHLSIIICQHIQALLLYQNAKTIAFYHATPDEVDLTYLQTRAEAEGKESYWPSIQPDKTLLFLPAKKNTPFKKNKFNINEPIVSHQKALSPEAFDLILIPLVSFDNHGTRLGHGQGYYDRTLAKHRPRSLVGVAFEIQHHMLIPKESWDVPLSAIITENGAHWVVGEQIQ